MAVVLDTSAAGRARATLQLHWGMSHRAGQAPVRVLEGAKVRLLVQVSPGAYARAGGHCVAAQALQHHPSHMRNHGEERMPLSDLSPPFTLSSSQRHCQTSSEINWEAGENCTATPMTHVTVPNLGVGRRRKGAPAPPIKVWDVSIEMYACGDEVLCVAL